MTYTIYNKTREILRIVDCSQISSLLQAKEGEYIMKGKANDSTQKIEFDGFDEEGQPINPRVVDKTPEEIETDNPTPAEIPIGKQAAHITNEQLDSIFQRLNTLEKNKGASDDRP